jgi:hypothetical protein
MARVGLIVGLIVALAVAALLHWTLPSRDIVRILGTEVARSKAETTTQGGQVVSVARDIRFIQAVTPGGATRVYRNEDTNWGWPPYFKFDSADLQAQASNLVSTPEAPKWVAVTHYGWRIQFFNIYPNAVGIRPVEGPDVTLIPWLNILILVCLAALGVLIWRMLAQFRERVIDPAVDRAAQTVDALDARADAARDRAAGVWGRFTAWLDTWRGKPRR